MGLSLDPINQVYGLRTPEGGLFSRCAGITSTTASEGQVTRYASWTVEISAELRTIVARSSGSMAPPSR
jgi:hypothetical protein